MAPSYYRMLAGSTVFTEPSKEPQQVSIRFERYGDISKIDDIKVTFVEITARRGTAPVRDNRGPADIARGFPATYYQSGSEATGGDFHNYLLDSKTGLEREYSHIRLLPGQTTDGIAFYLLPDGAKDGTKEFQFRIEALEATDNTIQALYQTIKIIDAQESTGQSAQSVFTVDPIVYVNEGQVATVTIRRSGNITDSHYIRLGESWRSSQLPAKIGEDFLGDFVGRELTILPNQSEISFQVSTIDDAIYEDLRSINWNGRGEWFDVIASISNGIRSNTPVKWENLPGYDSPEGQTRIFINDNDQPTPTYFLSPSSTSLNEGSALTTTVNTTNVASGTALYYSLSGTGITTADFSSGTLTGSGTVSSSGSFSFSHTLANDLTTEGTETLQIRLFTDSSRSTQVASTSVSINDTSLTPTSNVTVNGNNNGIANAGTINNNGTINTGTINTNSSNTTNNTTNTTVNNTNIVYNYFTNTTNNVNSNNTTNNVNSNNTLNTWNIFRVDATVKVADIVNQWFGTTTPTAKQSQDITDTKLLDINASTWTDKIQINRVAKATDNGDTLEALMPDIGGDPRVGSVLNGGAGKDVISGRAGWDVLDGGDADDLIHGGNGRDIITGGFGRDELHGDFGWNTYKSEKDGVSDLIAIKSDQYLSNWIYGKAGNNADGSKCDIIEGLDAVDKIKIIGVDTRDITFAANVTTKGLTGIGIYGNGALEALYTGGDLTINQITQMTSGDASAAAMANQVNSYGTW